MPWPPTCTSTPPCPRAPWPGPGRGAASRRWARTTPAAPRRWSGPRWRACAAAAIPTRWSPARMGQTAPTSSGSTPSKAFANISPRLSCCRCARWTFRRASSPATRAASATRSMAFGRCARATPMPGPRSGSPGAAGCAWTPPAPLRPVAPAPSRGCGGPRGRWVGGGGRGSGPGWLAAAMEQVISPDLTQSLRALWEAANNRWNQWVLNYTQSRQLDLLKSLGFATPAWPDLIVLLGLLVLLAALAGIAWSLWERNRHDPWLRLLARARQRLARAGLALPETLPPRALAERALARFGAPAAALAEWLLRLEQLRYAARPDTGLARLRREFGALPWSALARH